MLIYPRQFFKIRVFFHIVYLQNEVGDPAFFFYISDITNSSSYSGKNLRKKSVLENFCANVLKVWLRWFKNRNEQSCYTLKVLGGRTSRESWWCCSSTAAILLLNSTICIIILEKHNDYEMETIIFWASGHTKRQSVNIWDFALE